MSINNITGGRPDPIIQQIADAKPPAANERPVLSQLLPYDGAGGPAVRTSTDTSMPPQKKLSLEDAGTGIRKDGLNAAANDGGDAIKDMAAMNKMNMEFQVANGLMQMNKGFVEALSKSTKDIGTKTAQLAG
jgi:hypothetical protein